MIITLAAVMSINGRITCGANPNVGVWSSAEDKRHFSELVRTYDVIVMGASTYRAVRPSGDQPTVRIVMARSPATYTVEAVPGLLEFTSDAPAHIVGKLADAGYKKVLVAGGSHIYAAFLEAGAVDEMYITVEPVVFGSGTPLFAETDTMMAFRLDSVATLNGRGTLLVHYVRASPEKE